MDVEKKRARARTARDTVINKFNLELVNAEIAFESLLNKMAEEYAKELNKLKQELALSEKGTLIIRSKNRATYFSVSDNGREYGIKGESVYDFARRRYNEIRKQELEKILRQTLKLREITKTGYKRKASETAIGRFEGAGIDVLKILFTEEQNRWIDESYTPNPYHQANLIHQTESGIFVRSYGELNIANTLERLGIPYRYDDIVQVRDDKTGKIRTFFADFKIPNFRGGISILEHLGGFGFEGYSENAMERLNAYSNSSAINNSEIFWSFESTVNNADELKNLILRMLMPL